MTRASDLQEALHRLGAKRVESTLVAALLAEGPLGTRDLVERTGLRQPEVSVGMRALRDRGWVSAQTVPREGRGRPMHRYLLETDLASIRRHYEELGKATIHEVEEALRTVRRQLGHMRHAEGGTRAADAHAA